MREPEADNFAKNLSDAEERTFEESDLKRKESFVKKEQLKICQTRYCKWTMKLRISLMLMKESSENTI